MKFSTIATIATIALLNLFLEQNMKIMEISFSVFLDLSESCQRVVWNVTQQRSMGREAPLPIQPLPFKHIFIFNRSSHLDT